MPQANDQTAAAKGPLADRQRPPPIDPARDALFLDLDGTLAPLAPRPEAVGPEPRRTALLQRLQTRLGGRLAIVTGRSIAEADRILGGACQVVAGVHGLTVRCPAGQVRITSASPALTEALVQARAFAAERPGLIVEDKGPGLTLHYRQAPQHGDEAQRFGEQLAAASGLTTQPGDMVFEIREAGADKGSAVRTLMDLAPFSGARPIFVGDDLTDEDGFRAAEALGGHGVLVGGRPGSTADHGLADVGAVLAWLEAAL